MIQALASGTIDVYVAGVAPLAVARSKGIDVRVVAATAIEEMVFVAGPEARALFQPAASAGARRFAAVQGQGGQAPPASPRSRRARCRTPRCSTGSGRSPRPTRPMPRSSPWASTRRSRRCWPARSRARSIREPALTIVQSRNPAIKLSPPAARCSPTSPARWSPSRGAFADSEPGGRAGARRRAGAGRSTCSRPNPAEAAPPVEAALGKGIVDARHDPEGADLAGRQVRRRPARDRRRHGQGDAGLPGLDRHARQGRARSRACSMPSYYEKAAAK